MKNRLSFFVLFCLSGLFPRAAEITSISSWERMGVIITSNSGLKGDQQLQYSYKDGERLNSILQSLGLISKNSLSFLRVENIDVLRNKLKEIGQRINKINSQGKKIFLQVYYSGHGGGSYFHIGGGRISFEEIKLLLNVKKVDAKIFVLDVCYGASFFAAKGFKTTEAVPLEIKVDDMTKGEVIITSSSVDEQAYEVKPLAGSIFTSHWLMALRGAGDKDKNGQVSLFEAYNYSHDKTVAYTAQILNKSQHPKYDMQLQGGKDLMLTAPQVANSGILFKNCPPGNFLINNMDRKQSIGEVYIPGNGDFSLALEKGTYEIYYLPKLNSPKKVQVKLNNLKLTTLLFSKFRMTKGISGGKKGSLYFDPNRQYSPIKNWEISVGPGWSQSKENHFQHFMNYVTPLETHFALSETNRNSSLNNGITQIQAKIDIHKKWALGLKMSITDSDRWRLSKSGMESFTGTNTNIPISLSIDYDLRFIDFTPFAYFSIFENQFIELGTDVGFLLSLGSLTSNWELSRPLYELTQRTQYNYNFMGKGAEMGLQLALRRFMFGSVGVGILGNFGGYYRYTDKTTDKNSGILDRRMITETYGMKYGVSLTFNYLGGRY